MPRDQLKPADHQPCRAEDDPERSARQIRARWQESELGTDSLQLLFDAGEIGARLIGGPHMYDVGHAGRLSEAG